jgi:alcohol dehydrogenase (cytochrome c)
MLNRSDIASLALEGNAANPVLTAKLSSAEIDNLVAYLAQHKKRDFNQTAKMSPEPVLPYARLAASPDPKNWLTYWGGYNGHHFSALTQITPANVAGLQMRFAAPMLGERPLEATPIVVDGVMYVSGSPGDVAAFDAKSGLQIWSYHRNQDFKNPYQINPVNRGVAVLDGRVFFGTLDDNLIALDAHTGRQLWEKRLADTMLGYTLTGAPLALKDEIIVGVATSESGVRGWLKAFDPATGKELWSFEPVPLPGQKGNETWAGDSWKTGGIGLWLTPSFDVETNSIIVGTGQPVPDYNADLRKGDNLYSDCVVSLDADTGRMKWYYQFTPNDPHDWDSVQDMVLADQMIDGKPRKLILHADRNGFFYVLDRTNGKFLFAKPFVKQTWNLGFDKNGRPIIDPKSLATAQGQVVYPAIGGTNFQAPSYDAQSKMFYLAYSEAQGFAISAPAVNEPGKQFSGRGTGNPPPAPPPQQGIMAIDSATGSARWKFPLVQGSLSAGVLATQSGLVFASSGEGQLIALDAASGKPLWNFRAGLRINASPIAYEVDGQQYVAVSAGNMVYSFALPQ